LAENCKCMSVSATEPRASQLSNGCRRLLIGLCPYPCAFWTGRDSTMGAGYREMMGPRDRLLAQISVVGVQWSRKVFCNPSERCRQLYQVLLVRPIPETSSTANRCKA
jgi:hypothetical protein